MNRFAALLAAGLLTASLAAAEPCKVNVNTATEQQLEMLYRTGPVLSKAIIAARPLDAAKLDAVKGIGEKWLEVNGPHVSYAGPTTCTEKVKPAAEVKP